MPPERVRVHPDFAVQPFLSSAYMPIVSFLPSSAAVVLCALAVALTACAPTADEPLFTLLDATESGVQFRNELVEREGLNVLEYEYFYNGGGVAVGDVDGDGRPDLYFTANMGPNALYLNDGEMRFRDVTEPAGVAGGPGWTTGVTMADVNGDGLLDLYVCKSGRVSEALRRNELYINNGDGTFTESAAALGLDDPSYSTHASFFDYDGDGDLDMFLVNHAIERYSRFDVDVMTQMRDPLAGDKLYRNEAGRFRDVTVESGIFGNPIGFGLSASVSDVNLDGWPDVFVANDYIEDDYLYINNGDGTFSEELRRRFGHTSYSSMGTDIADVNNDGLPDIYTLDMMPEDPVRRKLLQGPPGYEQHENMIAHGYYRQYMRNMLQLNNGNGTFSEIGQLAGVAETDWSWAPLFADFDNDGLKDLYVTNGYFRDYTNMDFLMFVLEDSLRAARASGRSIDAYGLVRKMPQTPVPNYAFRNTDGLTFKDQSRLWGVDLASFSTGAAYGDLDGDGDLDLVVSNINRDAFIYRNEQSEFARSDGEDNRYLRVRLEGEAPNRFAVGAKVVVHGRSGESPREGSAPGDRFDTFYQELHPSRGYLSSVEPVLHFGVGPNTLVDVMVTWPDGRTRVVPDVQTNQTVRLSRDSGEPAGADESSSSPTHFVSVPDRLGLSFDHVEDDFVDFAREPLLPHMLSRRGPALAAADVNGDGLADVFFGGARGQTAELYLQQSDGTFRRVEVEAFDADARFEDVAAVFFDTDGDADFDLYVVSGGSAETTDLSGYQDRLYRNAGFGRLEPVDALPDMPASGGAVAPYDFDGDGDLDLFVGGRVVPGRYPEAPRSYLLENDGGRFADVTPDLLRSPGMVTTAVWTNLDLEDGTVDLIVAGEWMPIRAFRFGKGGGVEEISEKVGFGKTSGWWNVLHARDLDGDGDIDLLAGNRGLNHFLKADVDRPVTVYADDFDHDGGIEPILTYIAVDGKRYPVAWRDELLDEIPALHRIFRNYASYANATIERVLSDDQRAGALRLNAYEFATCIFENVGDGSLEKRSLPLEAQFAPVNDAVVLDLNLDGLHDLLLAGNDYGATPTWGAQTAGRGTVLINGGDMHFRTLPPDAGGFFAPNDVRRMTAVETPYGTVVVIANNDGPTETYGVNYAPVEPALTAAPRP